MDSLPSNDTMQTFDPSAATNWRKAQLFYDTNAQVWLNAAAPSAVALSFATELVTTPVSVTLANPSALISAMCDIPQSVRRGARLYVKLTHSVKGEWFGVEGVALIGDPYSNRAHKNG